jgi:hypothetical protein
MSAGLRRFWRGRRFCLPSPRVAAGMPVAPPHRSVLALLTNAPEPGMQNPDIGKTVPNPPLDELDQPFLRYSGETACPTLRRTAEAPYCIFFSA